MSPNCPNSPNSDDSDWSRHVRMSESLRRLGHRTGHRVVPFESSDPQTDGPRLLELEVASALKRRPRRTHALRRDVTLFCKGGDIAPGEQYVAGGVRHRFRGELAGNLQHDNLRIPEGTCAASWEGDGLGSGF